MKLLLIQIAGILLLSMSCKNEPVESIGGVNSPGNTSYYVDAQNGNDSNDGLTETSSWKTFERVNISTFKPGDKILLKCGSVWSGSLNPLGNGTVENPITIGSYSTGSKPIINGGGKAGAVVYLKNQSFWTIQNLEITNKASERSNIYRWGILVENANAGITKGIRIIGNTVHHVTGSFRWAEGFVDPHYNGGIAVNVTGSSPGDRFDDVLIEGNSVAASGRTGIVVWDNLWNGDGQASTNVLIRENMVHEIDSDGILTFGCDGAVLEYNIANTCGNYAESGQFNGSCAIWSTRGRNCISQFNEAFNTKALMDNIDGQGFDIDLDAKDFIVQYNYSHDNEGGFLLLIDAKGEAGVQNGTSGAIVRYNISQNDKKHLISFAGGIAPNSSIYNNTFYVGPGIAANIIDHSWDLDMTPLYSFKNNIIYNLGTGIYRIPGTAGDFDYNLYYGNHPTGEPDEVHKLTVNPMLQNPGGGGNGINSLADYQIITGSPALNSGTGISNNGGKDFWGNAVTDLMTPSRGAHQGGL